MHEHTYSTLDAWITAKAEFQQANPDRRIAYLATDEDTTAILQAVEATPGSTSHRIQGVFPQRRYVGSLAGCSLFRGTETSHFGVWEEQ